MDASESERLWNELSLLRERVSRLELQLSGAPKAIPAPAPPPAQAAAAPPVSFTPPARPSLESRIGSQLFNRVGIVAVLIGAAWFLKYAVDQQWLGPLARVAIGAAAGLGLIAWSERFRRRQYPVFAFSLKAVGTGLLYLVLWASFSLFHLVPYPVAFAGMVLVTVANAWLCWVQRSEVLAAYAAIGGFLTPALLAQEHTSVWTLGSYLVLLNAGLFALFLLRRWPRLLPAAFVGTATYLLGMAFHPAQLRGHGEAGAAIVLIALFFAAFSLASLAVARTHSADGDTNTPAEQAARAIAVGIALLNAVLGTFELWQLLPAGSFADHWLPALVAVWFAALLLAGRRRAAATMLKPVHAGLVIAFAALGLWSGLTGGGVVVGWALEAAVLLLLTLRQRPEQRGAETAMGSPLPSAILLAATALLLVADSLSHVLPNPALVLWNERFALYLLVIAVAVLAVRLAARQYAAHREGEREAARLRQWSVVGTGSAITATVLLLVAGALEIHNYWNGAGGTAEQFWYSAWATLLGVGLLVLGFRLRWAFLRWQALVLLTLAVAKVFLVDTRSLSQGFRILSFLGLGVLLLGVSFIYQRDLLHLRGKEHGG